MLRSVEVDDDRVVVTITPTYSGCPAMATMRDDLVHGLADAGFDAEVRVSLSPAWSSDWITPAGRAALAAHGISPPGQAPRGPVGLSLLPTRRSLACPRCGSDGGRADLGVRADGVQGGLPLHVLPGAVRAREGDLMTADRGGPRGHTRQLPHAHRRGGRAALRRRGRGDLRRARRPAGGVRLRGRAVADPAPDHRRRGPPPGLLDLRRSGGAAARGRAADPRRPLLAVAGRRGAAGRRGRGADPARELPRHAGRRAAPVHRRRVRDHADDVDRLDRAEPSRVPGDAALRQPHHGLGDVRRGAGRPEEPATPRASTWCTCSPASRATSSCSRGGWRPRGCVACSTALVAGRLGRPRVAVRPVRDDRGRARRAGGARRPSRAGALRAVLRRRASTRGRPAGAGRDG